VIADHAARSDNSNFACHEVFEVCKWVKGEELSGREEKKATGELEGGGFELKDQVFEMIAW
jgi:hypothetical protein